MHKIQFAIIEANGYSINETFIKLSDNPSRLKDVCVCSTNKVRQAVSELGGATGVVDIEQRMQDVKNRYGFYPQNKWDKNTELKQYFENIAKQNIYDIVGK